MAAVHRWLLYTGGCCTQVATAHNVAAVHRWLLYTGGCCTQVATAHNVATAHICGCCTQVAAVHRWLRHTHVAAIHRWLLKYNIRMCVCMRARVHSPPDKTLHVIANAAIRFFK